MLNQDIELTAFFDVNNIDQFNRIKTYYMNRFPTESIKTIEYPQNEDVKYITYLDNDNNETFSECCKSEILKIIDNDYYILKEIRKTSITKCDNLILDNPTTKYRDNIYINKNMIIQLTEYCKSNNIYDKDNEINYSLALVCKNNVDNFAVHINQILHAVQNSDILYKNSTKRYILNIWQKSYNKLVPQAKILESSDIPKIKNANSVSFFAKPGGIRKQILIIDNIIWIIHSKYEITCITNNNNNIFFNDELFFDNLFKNGTISVLLIDGEELNNNLFVSYHQLNENILRLLNNRVININKYKTITDLLKHENMTKGIIIYADNKVYKYKEKLLIDLKIKYTLDNTNPFNLYVKSNCADILFLSLVNENIRIMNIPKDVKNFSILEFEENNGNLIFKKIQNNKRNPDDISVAKSLINYMKNKIIDIYELEK